MAKKNKSKKRARTQRLYEAARKTQRQQDLHGGAGKNETQLFQQNGGFEKKKCTKEEIGLDHTRTIQKEDDLLDGYASDPQMINTNSVISDYELQHTIRTLQLLTATPQSIEMVRHSKRFKDFRRLLHPLVVQQLKTYDKGIDYRHRTTVHLAQQEFGAALTSLQACSDLEQIPKQGTIQRWVREVDSCGHGNLKISLLSRILTLGNSNEDLSAKSKKGATNLIAQDLEDDYEGLNKHDPQMTLLQAREEQSQRLDQSNNEPCGVTTLDSWIIPNTDRANADESVRIENQAENSNATRNGDESTKTPLTSSEGKLLNLNSCILFREKADERTPPNRFDLHLHYIIPKYDGDCILQPPSSTSTKGLPASMCPVPFLPGGRVLQNVFTDQECSNLIQIANTLGYRPDHPQALPQPTGIDSCEWLIPQTLQNLLYERVKDLLPPTNIDLQSQHVETSRDSDDDKAAESRSSHSRGSNSCFELNSINRRWRFFRYGQGCVYRPHIDGSWPESKIVPQNREGYDSRVHGGHPFCQHFRYDTDTSGETRSFLTFLIYLNDDFEGGATRFYRSSGTNTVPRSNSSSNEGGMVAQGVQPKKGCVLVFPQGNTASLLHEGSAVTSGKKFVVRTDVLYRRKSMKL